MADNTVLNSMTGGDTIGADDISGVKYQRMKLIHGIDGTNVGDVSTTNPLPVAFTRDATTFSDTTSTPLGIGATYTTPSFDVFAKGSFNTHSVIADQAGTCNYEESNDNSNWNLIKATPVAINTLHQKHNISMSRYWRIRYVNGAVAQTSFSLQAIGQVVGAPSLIGVDPENNIIQGDSQHNTAGAGADAFNTLPAIANAATPTYSETNVVALSTDLSGRTRVKVESELPAGTQNIGDVDIASAIPAGSAIIGSVGIDQTTPGTTNGVQITAAIPTGSNAIGKLAANNGVDIGDVDVTSLPAGVIAGMTSLPAGSNNIGDIDVATIAAGSNIIGNVRIDQTTPGTTNGVQITAAIPAGDNNIGNVDIITLPAGVIAGMTSLPTGSNAIGKLAANAGVIIGAVEIAATQTLATVTSITNAVTVAQPTAASLKNEPAGNVAHAGSDSGNPIKIGGRADTTFQTAVTDGQRVDALFGVYGELRVRTDQPNRWKTHEDSSNALTDYAVQAAPGAGLSVYITDIVFSTGAATACNIFFEEAAVKILGPYYLEAVAGRGISLQFATPHKCTANTAVTVTTSAAIAHGLDIMGFIAP